MKDEFHGKIIERLQGTVDPHLFELCAVDILQSLYPTITPVVGGADEGQDGYFFNTKSGSSGPLITTTSGRVLDNMRRNLRQYKSNGHKGRSVLVATTDQLTAQRRTHLEEEAKKQGFKLINVHDRPFFALQLYSNSAWAKRLLELEGNPQALSINPVSGRPVLSLEVRDREDLYAWIDSGGGDRVIVGQPGSGKTFAIRDYALKNEGLFVVSDNETQIISEIRDKKPRILIIDDADTRIDLVKAVMQMRQNSEADFDILLSGWLSHAVDLNSVLGVGSTSTYELNLLRQDTILKVINDFGIHGPDALLHQMVRQSEGKPGLAATLSFLALNDDMQKVFNGDALGEHLLNLVKNGIDPKALDILAVAAMGGKTGISLENIASLLGISSFEVKRTSQELAFGGVIEEKQSKIVVRPQQLRFYLVKEYYLSPGANIDFEPLLEQVTESKTDSVRVLLAAVHRSGVMDRRRLYELVNETGSQELLSGYAALGKEYADQVIDDYPSEALSAPGIYLDLSPSKIVPMLIEAAVGDERPLNSNSNHQLRILSDWIKSNAIVDGKNYQNREVLLDALSNWTIDEQNCSIAAQVFSAAFSPEYSDTSSDPGSGRTITFRNGKLSRRGVEEVEELWDSYSGLIHAFSESNFSYLIELLHSWAYGRQMANYEVSDGQMLAMNKMAEKIATTITTATTSPSVNQKVRIIADDVGLTVETTSDTDYEIIFPTEPFRVADDYKAVGKQQQAEAYKLAEQYVNSNPVEVVEHMNSLANHAAAVGKTYPDKTYSFFVRLAEIHGDLPGLSKASITNTNNVDISKPLLMKLLEQDHESCKEVLLMALHHEKHSHVAAELILQRDYSDDDLLAEITPIDDKYTHLVHIGALRGEFDIETLRHLLMHGEGKVPMFTASGIAYDYKDKGGIPAVLKDEWESALLSYDLEDNWSIDHYLTQALEKDYETMIKWLEQGIINHNGDPELYYFDDGFYRVAKDLLKHLTDDDKVQLIKALVSNGRSRKIATNLVGNSVHMFAQLLKNQTASVYALDSIANQSGSNWVDFVKMAIEARFSRDAIIAASFPRAFSFTGKGSHHFSFMKESFNEGVNSDNEEVKSIAEDIVQRYEARINYYQERECREEVYGE